MRFRPGFHRVALMSLLAALAACSSSDDKGSRELTLSTTALTFTADAPDAQTPPTQIITATVGEGVVNVAAIHTGTAIGNVTTTLQGGTAQIAVEPLAPLAVGPGQFTSTLMVTTYACADTACSRLAAGESRSVAVSYQVSPVVSYIAPRVTYTNDTAPLVVRGLGLDRFAIAGVNFGELPATETKTPTYSRIDVTPPALAAGVYPVTLSVPSHQGAVPSQASLLVRDRPSFTAQTLAYPVAPTAIRRVLFDPARDALLVATDANGGTLLRYAYDGANWSAPTSVNIADLQDVGLSIDGATLIAVARRALIPVDPETLALGTAVNDLALSADLFLTHIMVGNDNVAVITTGTASTGTASNDATFTPPYAYDIRTGAVAVPAFTYENATPAISGNGAQGVLVQGRPGRTNPLTLERYTPEAAFTSSVVSLQQNSIPPTMDRNATRAVFNGTQVFNGAADDLLGTLPATVAAVALRPDGTRAYTLDSATGGIHTYDISADANGEAYGEVGSMQTLAGAPGDAPRMIVTPDGGTLVIAGTTQVVVQPIP